jgi:predicted DNA-binding transcriptional regulator YafY
MPQNKHAIIRYKVINQMLTKGKTASKKMLAEACSGTLDKAISLRTIENDIYAMRYSEGLGYFAPIEYNYHERAYFYNDPAYSIDNLPVGNEEIQKLRLAANLLKQYKGISTFGDFSGAIDKVVRLINYTKLQQDGTPLDFIEFEKNPTTTGLEFIDQLIPLIQKKQVVKLHHQSFWRKEIAEFTVHPYYLKEYTGRWYLVGYAEERDAIRIFGLERIISIEPLMIKQFTSKLFNPESFFERFIGINVPEGPPENIVLRFNKNSGKYIETQPIHSSQKLIRENGNGHDFSYHLCVNWEFIGTVLSWQDNVEVLGPEGFRERIKSIIGRMAKLY